MKKLLLSLALAAMALTAQANLPQPPPSYTYSVIHTVYLGSTCIQMVVRDYYLVTWSWNPASRLFTRVETWIPELREPLSPPIEP